MRAMRILPIAAPILLRRNGNQRLSQDLARMRFGLFATDIL